MAAAALLVGIANGAGATVHGSRIAFGLVHGDLSSIYTVRANGTGLRRLS